MRSAALTSAAIVAIGAYLLIAATLSFAAPWIMIGTLAIALAGALAVASDGPRATASR